MNSKTFDLSSYTIGSDAYKNISNVCSKYGKKAVVIGGKTAMEKAKPFFDEALKDSNIEIISYIWYGGEASVENADALLEQSAVKEADMIFGVGGGKAIDTSKEVQIRTSLPLFTFPTIASTCAACTKIAIIYYPNGVSRETLVMAAPPVHVFINTIIIASSPYKYLWAGIGDTLGKYYEVSFSCRGKEIDYLNNFALQLAPLTNLYLLKYAYQALQDITLQKETIALTNVILDNIITTGYVSVCIDHKYNTALAHAIYYGLTLIDSVKHNHLHGEVVSYGVLVELMMDGMMEEYEKIKAFNKSINLPCSLHDLGITIDHPLLAEVIKKAKNNSGMEVIPYEVSEEMIFDAIKKIENDNN